MNELRDEQRLPVLKASYHCAVCMVDMGWDAPSGVCSTKCLRAGELACVSAQLQADERGLDELICRRGLLNVLELLIGIAARKADQHFSNREDVGASLWYGVVADLTRTRIRASKGR